MCLQKHLEITKILPNIINKVQEESTRYSIVSSSILAAKSFVFDVCHNKVPFYHEAYPLKICTRPLYTANNEQWAKLQCMNSICGICRANLFLISANYL